jgi:hypothetical protein
MFYLQNGQKLLALSEIKIVVMQRIAEQVGISLYTVVWKHIALKILTINIGKYFFLLCYYKVFTANAYRIESIESWHWYCNTYRIVNGCSFSPMTNIDFMI